MNKQTYPFLLSALALGLAGILSGCLVGCTKNPIEPLSSGSPTLQVSAGGATKVTGGVYWEEGDEVGLILTSVSPSDYEDSYFSQYSQVGYVVEAAGLSDDSKTAAFSAIAGDVFFENSAMELSFTSYGPYDSALSDDNGWTITASTSSQGTEAQQKQLDFIYASAQSATWNDPIVNYTYDHMMARIVLDFKPGDGIFTDDGDLDVNAVSGADYVLGGLVHSGTFNAKTGKASATSSGSGTGTNSVATKSDDGESGWSLSSNAVKSDLKEGENTVGVTYTATVFPQSETSELTITATVKNLVRTGVIKVPDGGITSGLVYTYAISVNGTELEVEDCTVTKWYDPEVDDWGTYGPMGSYVYIDDDFEMIFNSTPDLGSSGKICFYDYDSDELVDYIDIKDVVDEINNGVTQITSSTSQPYTFTTVMDAIYAYPSDGSASYRPVHFTPVSIDKSTGTVTIRHHLGVLEHGKKYYITVDDTCFSTDGDVKFDGIGKREWIVLTKPAPANSANVTVGQYGYDVDFRTVQGALCYAVGSNSSSTEVTVNVTEGTYEEFINVTGKSGLLTIRSSDGVGAAVITQASTDALNYGTGNSGTPKPEYGQTSSLTGGRSVLHTLSCNNLVIYGITFENTYVVSGSLPSAEAVYFNNDGSRRTACIDCTFRGYHSVVETKGYNLFYNCLIEGSMSYVWGYPTCSLFEKCELRAVSCETEPNKSICESRTKTGNLGFCFLNCDITASDDVETGSNHVLAASTAPITTYTVTVGTETQTLYYKDNIVFIDCPVSTSKFYGWGISYDDDTGDLIYPDVPQSVVASADGNVLTVSDGWKYYNFSGYTVPSVGSTDYNSGNWQYAYAVKEIEADPVNQIDENKEYSTYFKDALTVFQKFADPTYSGTSTWYTNLKTQYGLE